MKHNISAVAIGLIAAALVGCGGGGSSNSGGGSSSSSSTPSTTPFKITITDGQNLRVLSAPRGQQFTYQLDINNSGLDITEVSGCGLNTASVQTRIGGYTYLGWTPTADCDVTIKYHEPLATGKFVSLQVSGYGSALSTIEIGNIYVPNSKPLNIPLELSPGYAATGFGCDGRIERGAYIVDAVSENCSVDIQVAPEIGQKSHSVQVNFSGEPGGKSGSVTYDVIAGSVFYPDLGIASGFEPVVASTCESWATQSFIAKSDCTINVSVKLKDGYSIIAYAGDNDTYSTYVPSNNFYGRVNKYLASRPGDLAVMSIIPEPGFTLSHVDGCKADNDQISIHERTDYYGSHGVRDCAVIVETNPSDRMRTTDVDLFFAWDRKADPLEGNVTVERLPNAWNFVRLSDYGVNINNLRVQSYSWGTQIGNCGDFVVLNSDTVLLPPITSSAARCGLEVIPN